MSGLASVVLSAILRVDVSGVVIFYSILFFILPTGSSAEYALSPRPPASGVTGIPIVAYDYMFLSSN